MAWPWAGEESMTDLGLTDFATRYAAAWSGQNPVQRRVPAPIGGSLAPVNMLRLRRRISLILLVLGLPAVLRGQDVTVRLGASDSVYSERLGETRKLIVRLPADYGTSATRYPVLYLLDGSAG